MNPALLLVVDTAPCRTAAARLFPVATSCVMTPADMRPTTPFDGPLFAAIADASASAHTGAHSSDVTSGGGEKAIGLVVPLRWVGAHSPPPLVAIEDHVNVGLRGPLTGRWPALVPRSFPAMAGIYQPLPPANENPPRSRAGGSSGIYSRLVVAGVAVEARLTPFEAREVRKLGLSAVSSCLIAPVVIAAYHGLNVIAAGVPYEAPAAAESEDPS